MNYEYLLLSFIEEDEPQEEVAPTPAELSADSDEVPLKAANVVSNKN